MHYITEHLGLSAFLLFVLGDDALLLTDTIKAPSGKTINRFTFLDEPIGRCRELATQFFAPGSIQVSDARALLECRHRIWRSMWKGSKNE
jgi:hypothetical protein